jgi:phosphoglucomutase
MEVNYATPHIYMIYAESFKNGKHLDALVSEAREMVKDALKSPGPGRR